MAITVGATEELDGGGVVYDTDYGATLQGLIDDITDLRTKLVTHTQKMDTDFADVTNASINYEASLGLATQQVTKA